VIGRRAHSGRGVQHRKTKPCTPRTDGMIERFNGRMRREVAGITLYSHADLEIVLRGFNAAYNSRRQRVLNGPSPPIVPRRRFEADPVLANPSYRPPNPSVIAPRASSQTPRRSYNQAAKRRVYVA
jgi:transposase InsO family protein